MLVGIEKEDSNKGSSGGVHVIDVGMDNFMKEVVERSLKTPVIIDFWASWCEPCKKFTPVLEKLANMAKGAFLLAKVDTDKNPEITAQFGVQSLPTVVIFKNGQPLDGFSGVIPESQLKMIISRLTGFDFDATLDSDSMAKASELFDNGSYQEAIELYQSILEKDENATAAIGGMAKCYAMLDDFETANEIINSGEAPKNDSGIIAAKAIIDLKQKSQQSTLSDDMAKIYNQSLSKFFSNQQEQAMDDLLGIIEKNQEWDLGAAKARLIMFFDVLGNANPVTLKYRRKLSSILFA